MRKRHNAFTIIELLIVMAIIIILAGLVIGTSGYVQKKGARSRAEAEIAAFSAGLESYKADNGIYPRDANSSDQLDARTATDPLSYAAASLWLYQSLSGDSDGDGGTPENKSYIQLKPNQISRNNMSQPASASNKVTGVRDPFGNFYGYSTAYAAALETNPSAAPTRGYNPTFDLWSTANGGQNEWIKNW
ncbi:MAG: type II secretion system protein [Chthoniobacterales bacterium]